MLDIGCGPAPRAIGFAPYVASCDGVDPEPAMPAAASAQASVARRSLCAAKCAIDIALRLDPSVALLLDKIADGEIRLRAGGAST